MKGDSEKLSTAQKRALGKLFHEDWASPYELKESRVTLDSLARKGLAVRYTGDGHMFFPRVSILYRISEDGLAAISSPPKDKAR